MRAPLIREYFGRDHFGTIFGFSSGILMLGSIIGPPVAGWVFDTWGSYKGIWLAFVALTIFSAIIMVTASRQVKIKVNITAA